MQIKGAQEYLLLPKNIALSRTERQEMCRIMESSLKEIYKVSMFHRGIVTIDGKDVDTTYILKAINNTLLLKKIISDPRREIVTSINNKEDLFDFVKANLNELFHPHGIYFKYVYELLKFTTKKGESSEDIAFKYVEEVARRKGLQIEVLKPRELSDDVYGGIDGFFVYNDREFTIQVKPLSETIEPNIEEDIENPEYIRANCAGFIKGLKTDYLVLTDLRKKKTFLFKAKDIIVENNCFLIPKSNKAD